MFDFFHGWRRKAGCALLVLVSASVFWWARSRSFTDVLCIPEKNRRLNSLFLDVVTFFDSDYVNVVASNESSLVWLRRKYRDGDDCVYRSYPTGGDVLDRIIPQMDANKIPVVQVPYSIFVIPLTLLSAYLLLWPGKQPPKSPPN